MYKSSGVEILSEPEDMPWGMREFNIKDLNGHRLRFGRNSPETEPKLKIERVDLGVRIEKRLAAAVEDLAE